MENNNLETHFFMNKMVIQSVKDDKFSLSNLKFLINVEL